MLEIGPAIKARREKRGWSQTKLATLAGTTAASISRIETGRFRPSHDTLRSVVGALGISLDDFYASLSTSNVIHADLGVRRIPVLDYVQAGKWTGVDSHPVNDDERETILADLDHPPSTFAMRIRGDSMEPEFRAGEIVIISPLLQPRPGDFVVASEDSGEATFKQYKSVGRNEAGHDVFELVAMNSLYGSMRSDRHNIAIVGVMVEHHKYRRR